MSNRRFALSLTAGVILLGGIGAWLILRPGKPSEGTPATQKPQTGVPTAGDANRPGTSGKEKGDPPRQPEMKIERDATAVFQRAFWRRPGKDDRILHGERREWLNSAGQVEKWQWFVVVTPSPEFQRVLLEENPFELVKAANGAELPKIDSAPPWFPQMTDLAACVIYRNRGGRFLVFHDKMSGKIYATDDGRGFAAPGK